VKTSSLVILALNLLSVEDSQALALNKINIILTVLLISYYV